MGVSPRKEAGEEGEVKMKLRAAVRTRDAREGGVGMCTESASQHSSGGTKLGKREGGRGFSAE